MFVLLEEFVILCLINDIGGRSFADHFEDPWLIRLLVDERGVFEDFFVESNKFSIRRGVYIGGGFHALDSDDSSACLEILAHCWVLDVDDFS